MDFKTLPKVELHLHFDCSLSYAVVSRLNLSITLEDFRNDFIAPAKCATLTEVLSRAANSIALMQTEEQLRLVIFDVFEQLQQEHVYYAELRFAPLLHTTKGLTAEEVVAIVEAATASASQATGVEARIILCTLRHFTAEQSMQTVQLIERFRGTSVVALDIAGDETGYPLEPHVPTFQFAAQHGIPYTAHAGESAGAESVWETLRLLGTSRIGHGVHCIEDPMLVEHLRNEHIHLEICPSSNYQTNAVDTYANHPIAKLYDAGLSLSVNSDDRTLCNINLAREYEKLHFIFGWDEIHFLHCNLNALRAAFLPEDIKQRLENRLREEYSRI
ncbi:MAG TPA: adenosine deaminase [Ktedonobacteraceae bacterium]|nr:adenosine deaminase [Ktedonobacteraceae bacterium]